jgi:predicted PurR-regulated permease PerM
MFITFYLFIDGRSFLEEFKRLSPLDSRYNQEIIDELFKTIKLTFKGSLVIAVLQGILGATGFLLSGIDSWALWGAVMVLASLIPVVGTALIWGPAALIQAVTGHLWAAGFIVFWGIAVIGLADNLLRPQLLKGDTNIHPLLIFFSVMGGLSYFGFLGIILGPLILSLLVYILTMYKKFINPQTLKADI